MLWIILSIVGGLCFLVVLGGGGLVAWVMMVEARKEKAVRRDGRPVAAALVMANHSLYEADGDPQTAGVVVFSFDPPSRAQANQLIAIASDVYQLYSADDVSRETPSRQHVAAIIKDHNYREGRRNRLPPELTGGRTIYLADLWIHRDRLAPDWQTGRIFACKATIDSSDPDKGQIIHLGPVDAEAQQVYQAVG